jgi:hypothetical protein
MINLILQQWPVNIEIRPHRLKSVLKIVEISDHFKGRFENDRHVKGQCLSLLFQFSQNFTV